jgi:hypothetical protein
MDLFFTENTSWQLAWAIAVTLISAYAHGVLGLGFVSVAMPLLIFFVSFRTAMIITVPVAFFLTARLTFWGHQTRETLVRFWFMPAMAVLGSLVGAWVYQTVSSLVLLWIVFGALTLFLSVDMLKGRAPRIPENWYLPIGALCGFLAGITETSVNMGAPFLLLFFLLTVLSTHVIVQVCNLCFFVGKLVHITTLSIGGAGSPGVSLEEWIPGFIIAPLCLLLCNQGVKLRERVSVETYRRWLKIILFVIALMLLGRIVSMTSDNRTELPVEAKNAVVVTIDRGNG